ncbi:MAG: DNA-3-methyladenine glycosylase 2 family protein [Planctomycetia bacterium]|nr:DNA-3-methyladenine glycosylase 2 family protein [Planctomycetia bacterium]
MPPIVHYLPDALRTLQRDRSLKKIIQQVGEFQPRPTPPRDYFPILVNSIVSQMLSLKAAATIQQRLRDRLKPGKVEPAGMLRITIEELKKVGLSTTKAQAMHDLARRTLEGVLPLKSFTKLENHDIIEHLVEVRGIGRWTAEMFLMFGLVRPDVWPIDDLGLRAAVKRLDRLKDMPDKKYMLSRGEVYAPYRTVASWYLWQSLKLPE